MGSDYRCARGVSPSPRVRGEAGDIFSRSDVTTQRRLRLERHMRRRL